MYMFLLSYHLRHLNRYFRSFSLHLPPTTRLRIYVITCLQYRACRHRTFRI
jgi:hypothetical protein